MRTFTILTAAFILIAGAFGCSAVAPGTDVGGADGGEGEILDECIPSKEICNHIDDDCDGYTDEDDTSQPITKDVCDDHNPCTTEYCGGDEGCKYELLSGNECEVDACTIDGVCVEGVCVGTPIDCDDGNDCTAEDCNVAGGCVYYPITGQDCDDSDLCAANDNCVAGECVGKLVICNDGNLCTDDECFPADGCGYTPNNVPCDDGKMCTGPDLCEAGACVGEDLFCDCLNDADCSSFEDGNLCNGTLYCDTTQAPFACQVSPGSVVSCPAPQGPASPVRPSIAPTATSVPWTAATRMRPAVTWPSMVSLATTPKCARKTTCAFSENASGPPLMSVAPPTAIATTATPVRRMSASSTPGSASSSSRA